MRLLVALWICAGVYAQTNGVMDPKVRSVLAENCIRCHGGENTLSGFDLSSGASFRKGGKHGEAVIAGKPDESRLFQWVSSGKMPQGGKKLSPEDIEAIQRWIASGAPWPDDVKLTTPAQKKVFWAFRTPVKPAVPAIEGAENPIDAFILQKLRSKGLDLNPRASEATLLRRASFDLTGLPPAPGSGHESYEQAVNRLLASPQYGERWGRHWLDVVRFGETDGGEHNIERMHAWRYRDYVIDAFNQDKPYNQFIREQIAGDILSPNDPKLVAATGFLVAGPWDSVSAELNKDKNMAATARMDELDDLVTTTFHTFQAMTVNCARCHDHKFDPIPSRDYYKLTSVFSGVGFGTRKVATPEQQAAYEAASKPVREELGKARKALNAVEAPVRTRLLRAKYIALDKQRESEPLRLPLDAVWNRDRFAPVTVRHLRLVITANNGKAPKLDSVRLLPSGPALENWKGTAKASDDAPVIVPLPTSGPVQVSEMVWSSDGVMGGRDGLVTVYRLEASDDGQTWRTLCSSLDHVGGNELEMPKVSEEELLAALPPQSREERSRLQAEVARLDAELKKIPELPQVYAAKPRTVAKAFVLERGSVTRPKDEVTPGTLVAISQLSPDFHQNADTPDAARRLALADSITDPRNPLTARVIVNRVWHYHFGQGIVNTPSDFGLNGDRPSHPELLDWLAVSFMENGWSIKWLQRQILSSRTYQQSSAFQQKAHEVDGNNRLLWRMPLQRMDAETLRDSILFVSGKLDLDKRGGPGFLLQKKGDGGSYIYKVLDNDGPEVWKRAVYRFVVRGGERIMLDSFDCPDPAVATPQRSISNTAVQALTLLNNDFVVRQAGFLAERLQREAGASPEAQIGRAYDVLFGRKPSAHEQQLGLKFLESQPLAIYCRVLLNSNEFVYVP